MKPPIGLQAWPEYALPSEPLNDNYSVQLPNPLIRSDFDQGQQRQRKVMNAAPATFTVYWPLTDAQSEIYKGWKKWAINDGQDWFTLPVFVGGNYECVCARFVAGTEQWTRSGNEWVVQVNIEIPEMPAMTASCTAIALMGGGDSAVEIAELLDTWLSTDYPAACPS
jgi:hypothetical protein